MAIAFEDYPFVKELVTNTSGQVGKVVLDLEAYLKLLEILEDDGLYKAILEVQDEIPLTLVEALNELEKE